MKEYTFEIVLIIVLLILWTLIIYPNYEEIKKYLAQSMGQSSNQSFQESFVKSCYASAKISAQKNLDRELASAEMEQLKEACECLITAGEKEGIFEKKFFEVTKYYADTENMNYLISKYECLP